jgi:GNAT superfamily N-acetyltransferase
MVLADTAAGYGCLANLPKNASGFLTSEMKSNHLGTARDGAVSCIAKPVHLGRTTQVWDATITRVDTGRIVALFRCTQLLLYPDPVAAVTALPSIEMREVQRGDSIAVRDLVLRILNEEYAMALALDELPDLVDAYATYRDSGEGSFWVAMIDGCIVGCIGILRLAGADYELRRMYVQAEYRGRGIAQRLLDSVFAWSEGRGVGCLWLETNEHWLAAHHIYEKYGFQPIERDRLPASFPVVRVATGFYRLVLADRHNSDSTAS